MTNQEFSNLIATLTIEQANAWNLTGEKWMFCTDILDVWGYRRNDFSVDQIEAKFEELLAI